jgi:RNA-binding protein NOB1
LREDQREYARAVEKENRKEEREHERLLKAMGQSAGSVKVGEWSDPDWLPGMLLGGEKRRDGSGLPMIGVGKKNPNERRRRK